MFLGPGLTPPQMDLAWESSPGALLMLALAGSEASPYSAVTAVTAKQLERCDAKPSSKMAPEKPQHQEDPEDPASFNSAVIAPSRIDWRRGPRSFLNRIQERQKSQSRVASNAPAPNGQYNRPRN
ncbi:hypothetical protein E4U32_002024 [Claviceps aff. humidiphila group G2b]|nr:hypothetical protein E4U32_002024 [Claviceps aff. humidiphila group G2b]